jgi:D-beta-D-heptose 7-phosphate kinase/D-beta-D-heptose 1-phosphate adenosyltransferase
MRAQSTNPGFLELIGRFAGKRMLAIGDLMLDEFVWGRVSRISPEAPVPVVKVTREAYYPGGAANVARNLREFTDATAVAGMAGADAPGRRLIELLQTAGIDTEGVVQVVRVDRERRAELSREQLERVAEYLDTAVAAADGIVVADYGKGFLNQALADEICRLARKHGKILTVDPHPHTSLAWRGATAIKPNRIEAFSAAGLPIAEPVEPACRDQALIEAAQRLRGLWQSTSLLVTLGEQGMLLFDGAAAPVHLPAQTHEVFDVSGAGDTAIAVFTLGLVSGATPAEAAELANRASGIVVGKFGTATVTPAELMAAFGA